MRRLLDRLHKRMGDFWWYSLMLFCACRAADLLNAFVGLWLVPKYVDPSELGAVLPLTQFANLLAMPIVAFANTFRNELARLSICREFGKLKSLMRGVFVVTAVVLFLAIIIARVTLPMFLNRIRIVEGSLGLIIIATAFVGAVAPIYSNAVQVLQKFKAQSLISIVGAPIRLLAMLVTMPFRAISGYFIGQAAVPMFSIAASVVALRKELSVPAVPYWSRDTIQKFAKILTLFVIGGIVNSVDNLVESTVLRQRLPDLDSAGYYMATRFSDISNFLYSTLTFTIFPFTAALAAKGKDMRPMILKASAATIVFSTLIAIPFVFFGKHILAILPHGEQYMAYGWAIPWQIGISTLAALVGLYVTAEVSANRFSFLIWTGSIDLIYPALLLLVTGHGYLVGIIPASWTAFLTEHNIRSLDAMLWWMTGFYSIKTLGCILAMAMSRGCKETNGTIND